MILRLSPTVRVRLGHGSTDCYCCSLFLLLLFLGPLSLWPSPSQALAITPINYYLSIGLVQDVREKCLVRNDENGRTSEFVYASMVLFLFYGPQAYWPPGICVAEMSFTVYSESHFNHYQDINLVNDHFSCDPRGRRPEITTMAVLSASRQNKKNKKNMSLCIIWNV